MGVWSKVNKSIAVFLIVTGFHVFSRDATAESLKVLEKVFQKARIISDNEIPLFLNLETTDCSQEQVALHEFDSLNVSRNHEYLDEVRYLGNPPSKLGIVSHPVLLFRLSEQSTGQVIEYFKCSTAQLRSTEQVDVVAFGPYARLRNSFDSMAVVRKNERVIDPNRIFVATRKSDEPGLVVHISTTTYRLLPHLSVNSSWDLKPELEASIKSFLRNDHACLGNCRDAGVESLQVYSDRGRYYLEGTFWAASEHQMGGKTIYSEEKRHLNFEIAIVYQGDTWKIAPESRALNHPNVRVPSLLGNPLAGKVAAFLLGPTAKTKVKMDVKKIFEGIIAPYLDKHTDLYPRILN